SPPPLPLSPLFLRPPPPPRPPPFPLPAPLPFWRRPRRCRPSRPHAPESLPRRLLPAAARRRPSSTGRNSRSPPRPETRSRVAIRSEEHTSELQSRFDLVCRLLLEKKKN